jgi:hypothetical protein
MIDGVPFLDLSVLGKVSLRVTMSHSRSSHIIRVNVTLGDVLSI